MQFFFFFSSRRRHTRSLRDWSSDVCSSDLIPAAVEVFGDQAELDDQDAREIETGNFTAFFVPQAHEGLLVLAHNDAGIGATDEVYAVRLMWLVSRGNRHWLWLSARFLR